MATKPKTTKYKQSSAVTSLQKQLVAQKKAKPADWNGGTYQEAVRNAMEKILNRDKFSYDLNGDALYQQYKDQYSVLGKQAMMDRGGSPYRAFSSLCESRQHHSVYSLPAIYRRAA